MKFFMKTKEECDAIVERNEAFYRVDREVEGQKVAIYDYRLANVNDFVNDEAFELRGLTFVQGSDGGWNRYLLMNKFFNVNQTTMKNILEITIEDNGKEHILKVKEDHIFKIKNSLNEIIEKEASDLTENDDIIGWDELKVQ